MCPMCVTTAVITASSAASGAGVMAIVAAKWRTLQRWLRGGRHA